LHQLARIKKSKELLEQSIEERSRKMTLQPQNEFSIPEETIRVARAAYPKGNRSVKMRDVSTSA
jgi:hypothetical protein